MDAVRAPEPVAVESAQTYFRRMCEDPESGGSGRRSELMRSLREGYSSEAGAPRDGTAKSFRPLAATRSNTTPAPKSAMQKALGSDWV